MRRLQDEVYLFQNGETLESIVNRLIPRFENEYKRNTDVTGRCGNRVYIAGLRSNTAKRFEANNLLMNKYALLYIALILSDARAEQIMRKFSQTS